MKTWAVAASVRGAVGRHPLVRSLAWSFSGEVFSRVAVLVTAFIAVRALAPDQFGQYIALSATAVLAASLWDAGGSVLLTREFAAGGLSARSAVFQIMRLRLQTFALWLAAFLVGVTIIGRGEAVSLATILGFGCASLLFSCGLVPLAMLRARDQFRAAGVSLTVGRWSTALLSLLAVLPTGQPRRMEFIALALLAGEALTLATAAIGAARLRAGVGPERARQPAPLLLRAAMPFAANGLLAMAYNRFDVILVAALTSVGQVAAYAPASRIQDALYVIPTTIGVVAFPRIARTWHRDDEDGPNQIRRLVHQLIVGGLAVSVPISLLGTVLAPTIIDVVLGPAYAVAVTPTRILIWFLPLAVIQAPLLAALGATNRAGDTTRVFAVAFLTAIILHLLLDPRWGAAGAAVASLSRDISAALVAVILMRRAVPVALSHLAEPVYPTGVV